jgi:hypothetical protein
LLRPSTLAATFFLVALTSTTVSAQGAAAASSAQKPAATSSSTAIRPGTYDLDVAFGGGILQGTLELATVGDSLTAKLHVGEHEPPIRTLTRQGSRLTLNAGAEGMSLVYELKFDGDAISGSFTMNGDQGLVTGKRRK